MMKIKRFRVIFKDNTGNLRKVLIPAMDYTKAKLIVRDFFNVYTTQISSISWYDTIEY